MNLLEFPADPDTARTCWKQALLFKDRYAVVTAVMTCNPIRRILPSDRVSQPSRSARAGTPDNLTFNKTGSEGGIQLLSYGCEREDVCLQLQRRRRPLQTQHFAKATGTLYLRAFLLGTLRSCPCCHVPVPPRPSGACKDLREDHPAGRAWQKGWPRGSASLSPREGCKRRMGTQRYPNPILHSPNKMFITANSDQRGKTKENGAYGLWLGRRNSIGEERCHRGGCTVPWAPHSARSLSSRCQRYWPDWDRIQPSKEPTVDGCIFNI